MLIHLLALLACTPMPDTGFSTPDWGFAFTVTISEYRSPGGGEGAAWASVDNRESEAPPWDLELAVGECGFYGVRPQQNCEPACEAGTVCSWDGDCLEPAAPIDAGDIAVDGLSVDLSLEPNGEWIYYGYEFEPEPSDGEIFDQGDMITASAAGASLPGFQLETLGVAPLSSDIPCPIDADYDDDLRVRWAPGQPGDRVRLSLSSANHGSQFPALICEAEDDGELTVDAALVAAWQDTSLPVRGWRMERLHQASDEVQDVPVTLQAQALEGCSW
jgi:hypothetical protein